MQRRTLVVVVMAVGHGRVLRREEEIQRVLGRQLAHRRRRLADGDQRRGMGVLRGLGGPSLSQSYGGVHVG